MRIGIMGNVDRIISPTFPPALKRLAELGFVEGKNTVIEYRESRGVTERVAQQARELLALNLDLIITLGPVPPVRELIAAKATLPIVFCAIDYDPVESGIVANYNRPGANITGAYIPQPALTGKRFELARELLPAARRLLVFHDAFSEDQFAALKKVAEKTLIAIEEVQFRAPPYDYATGFKPRAAGRTHAFICLMSPLFFKDRAQIAALALKERLPAIGGANAFAEAGFLASYGAPLAKVAERTAEIAARILRGAKAAETPVEQINEFEFAVNKKIAKILGIAIPQSVLVRADKVIE